MKQVTVALFCLIAWAGIARAEVSPVEISAVETTAWTGERVRIRIELRAPGSFSGSAGFDLPEIPGILLLKVGNPVVSSKEIEGESWFVQTHEFALFSQKSGTVTIPSFPVRFEAREGFTGPANPVVAKTKPVSIEIQRPPGSESIPFLVTTDNLQITESWDPDPGEVAEAKVGDVFRRTIVQRSSGLTGMALSPASTNAPEGVRVYGPQVETSDNTERGAFDGERRETLTYLLQKSGPVTLPALEYTWWNPKNETLESKVLSEVVLSVAAAPVTETPGSEATEGSWVTWLLVIGLGLLLFWKKQTIFDAFSRGWRLLNPPESQAARKLRRACRQDDPAAAEGAWNEWLTAMGGSREIGEELRSALLGMHRVLYGPTAGESWTGSELWEAFSEQRSRKARFRVPLKTSKLPALNSPVAGTPPI